MKDYKAVVAHVEPDSIAEELGIVPGDVIARINGEDIDDYFDYKYLSADEELELTVIKQNGSAEVISLYNEEQEDLGITFSRMLFGEAKSCSNRCIFCFIDQLPPGMRDTMYFKDDDTRLSFLYGNYVTLTNMSDAELNKIIKYRISPVNISVHTVDPALREKMLHNRFAGRIMEQIQLLYDGGITMNMQIVLCPGVNDGAQLEQTIRTLTALHPRVESISIVPVGVTRYREGLYPIRTFDAEGAAAVIRQVEAHQARLLKAVGSRMVYLSDEFYILAGLPLPPYEAYETFPQIENGVGLIASMQREFNDALQAAAPQPLNRTGSIATGEFAYSFISGLVKTFNMRYNSHIQVFEIKNDFFGGKVTVSGLLCGCDLIRQLNGKDLGGRLYITQSMLKAGEDVFLDDVTLAEAEAALGVPITPIPNDGYAFLEALSGK